MRLQIFGAEPIWLQTLLECILGLLIALFLRRFVCMFAFVKGRSMQNTLQDGELLFGQRRTFRRRINRFDVVLCKYPKRKGLFVKRVVALPGERVAMRDGVLYINHDALEEAFPLKVYLREMTERTVPDDSYFVMGDNRPASRDSRSVGAIADAKVIAIVKCVVFPFRKIRRI